MRAIGASLGMLLMTNRLRTYYNNKAASDASVCVNKHAAWRKGSFFHGLVEAQNAAAPAYHEARIDAVKPGGAPDGKDIASTETGHVFLAKTPEVFSHDDDGNLTGDGRWIYTWNGENRLIAMETPG